MIEATEATDVQDGSVSELRGDAPAPEMTFVADEGGTTLSVTIDTGRRQIVRAASHSGSADPRTIQVLDQFCLIITGRPLQEAADHGAIYAASALPDLCAPISGVRTPRNAGPEFALAERLVRNVHAQALKHFNVGHRDNAWYMRASADWLAKNEAEQATVLKPIIADFLSKNGLTESDIWISGIDRGTRVTIAFSEGISYSLKPKLMMMIEQRLREETGDPFELFMEEVKDANKLRRL
jgi:hypothetical protein